MVFTLVLFLCLILFRLTGFVLFWLTSFVLFRLTGFVLFRLTSFEKFKDDDPNDVENGQGEMTDVVDIAPVQQGLVNPEEQESHAEVVEPTHSYEPGVPVKPGLHGGAEPWSDPPSPHVLHHEAEGYRAKGEIVP